jgi:ATP-dependent helicase/nuclease subunit A
VGLPVQVHTAGQFFERREVVDALALLKFLINPHDNKNLITLLRSPFGFLRDQDILDAISGKQTGSGFTSHWTKILTLRHPRVEELKKLQELIAKKGIGQTWFEGLIRLGFFDLSEKIDSTGRREANLWKLITLVRAQEKKPGFLYLDFLKSQGVGELDLESAGEGDAVPVVEPRRVNLMTIHASKGLQFDHVIIADLGGKTANSRTEFFNYDEKNGKWTLALPDPHEGSKKTSLFGLQLVEEKREREEQELDRQLYVALTRAKQTVTLISSERPVSASWAARLKVNTSPGVQSTDNYDYIVRPQIDPIEVQQKDEWNEKLPQEKWQSKNKHPVFTLKTTSVTEILDRQTQDKLSHHVRKKMSIASVQKAITGVDIHRVFESIQYHILKDPQFSPESLLSDLNEKEQIALQYLLHDQKGLWLDLIKDGHVEWGFAVLHEEGDSKSLIQGQIDLWGIDKDGQAWVVDYKTGSPEALEKALEQLKIYTWALSKMIKLQPNQSVKLAVIYPLAGLTEVRTCRVDEIQI